jgi:peptidyl-prolyl cis-trans isomerase A (cyclophilin A)
VTKATLHTTKGDIVIDLFDNHAPKTVKNFTDLIEKGFYNGTIFHRVIAGFMIQGGCPQGTGTGGPGYKFADEFHGELSFDRPYLLAMANAGPNTNGSQFFITAAPTTWLNRKHSIFGEVTDEESKKVVDAIEATKTGAMDRPVEAITINSVTISE